MAAARSMLTRAQSMVFVMSSAELSTLSTYHPTTAQVADILTAAFEVEELEKLEATVAATTLLSPDGRVVLTGALALAVRREWQFGGSGKPKVPIVHDDQLRVKRASATDMDSVRNASFPDAPSTMLDVARLRSVRDTYSHVPAAVPTAAPEALVTIGPSGAGKTTVVHRLVNRHVQQEYGGPSGFVDIDPDLFMSALCNNDNSQRALANFCNHESFIYAIGQRRPLIFQGTGKSLETTCSRVIGRLQEAGYRVFVVMVIASPLTCLRRVKDRKQQTGRGVPEFVVRGTINALREVAPTYLAQRGALCESVFIYDNDSDNTPVEPSITLRPGDEASAALAMIEMRLSDEPSAVQHSG